MGALCVHQETRASDLRCDPLQRNRATARLSQQAPSNAHVRHSDIDEKPQRKNLPKETRESKTIDA